MAVLIAGLKVHQRINTRRICTENVLNAAGGLDEISPFGGAKESKAADAITNGNLISSLNLAGLLEDLFNGLTPRGHSVVQPSDGKAERRSSCVHSGRAFGHEGIRQHGIRFHHIRQH